MNDNFIERSFDYRARHSTADDREAREDVARGRQAFLAATTVRRGRSRSPSPPRVSHKQRMEQNPDEKREYLKRMKPKNPDSKRRFTEEDKAEIEGIESEKNRRYSTFIKLFEDIRERVKERRELLPEGMYPRGAQGHEMAYFPRYYMDIMDTLADEYENEGPARSNADFLAGVRH